MLVPVGLIYSVHFLAKSHLIELPGSANAELWALFLFLFFLPGQVLSLYDLNQVLCAAAAFLA